MSCIFPFKAYKCSIGKYGLSHTRSKIFSFPVFWDTKGVLARMWKYDSLSRFPPGQFETRFADFFRVLSRGKRGGKREMEIEKLEKGESSWSTARYALSARRILPSLPRQSLFMLRYYLKRCTLSCNPPNEILSFFFLSSLNQLYHMKIPTTL